MKKAHYIRGVITTERLFFAFVTPILLQLFQQPTFDGYTEAIGGGEGRKNIITRQSK